MFLLILLPPPGSNAQLTDAVKSRMGSLGASRNGCRQTKSEPQNSIQKIFWVPLAANPKASFGLRMALNFATKSTKNTKEEFEPRMHTDAHGSVIFIMNFKRRISVDKRFPSSNREQDVPTSFPVLPAITPSRSGCLPVRKRLSDCGGRVMSSFRQKRTHTDFIRNRMNHRFAGEYGSLRQAQCVKARSLCDGRGRVEPRKTPSPAACR